MQSDQNSLSATPADGMSSVHGSDADALLDLTIGKLLRRTADKFPDREAAVFADRDMRWTYREFDTHVDALAKGLHSLGLVAGDRVGIWAPNCPEWLLTQFATARLGIILVNINPAYRVSELEFALNKVACRALVTAAAYKSSDYVAMLRELAPELNKDEPELVASRLPHLEFVISTGDKKNSGMHRFDDVVVSSSSIDDTTLDTIEASLHSRQSINIQFTSGTTGLPKGATLTHHNIVNNAQFVTLAMNFSEADRLCIPVPLYHCFGMVMGTLGCVTKGATMIIPSEGFEPLATLAAIERERCTALYAVPTMFVGMLDHTEFGNFEISSLRTGIMAGAPCPIEVMKRVQADMHMKEITIAYGMTETSPVSFQSGVNDPLDKRVSSVGRIHPHVDVKIIDESGAIVPVGTQGELCTKGYSVMQGYWADDEQTAKSIDADGWMHTGDLAIIDAEGYCNITGRLKDMIVRGGENVYPREIEEYLYRIQAIAQVQVFGIPDVKYGESVCAWIVLRDGHALTVNDVLEFCNGKIAHYKIPVTIEFVESIPMTVTGKPQKFRMRQSMVEQLGLEEIRTA